MFQETNRKEKVALSTWPPGLPNTNLDAFISPLCQLKKPTRCFIETIIIIVDASFIKIDYVADLPTLGQRCALHQVAHITDANKMRESRIVDISEASRKTSAAEKWSSSILSSTTGLLYLLQIPLQKRPSSNTFTSYSPSHPRNSVAEAHTTVLHNLTKR